ncbi:MAG TPA: hypothetical protein VIM65_20560 [Cyclobacteriaceae bacterium]
MKDELEKFVHENRQAFDDREPADKVWSNIQSSLPIAHKVSIWNSVTIWRAAAVVFFALSIYLLIPKTITVHNQAANRDPAFNEFNDVEAFYVEQISQKVELIDEFQRNEGLNGFTQDFKQLEAMYSVLKEEMKNHPSQKVKDALVLNLLVRIDLLNQQLHHLEEDASSKEKKAENAKVS